MDTVGYIRKLAMPAAEALLPPAMASAEARAFGLAIGLQESRFVFRRQIGGPARSFWQFEPNGVQGVLQHRSSRPHLLIALKTLGYQDSVASVYEAIAHNDVLAYIVARLLVFTSPSALPRKGDPDAAWRYYLDCWRPGRPHAETWGDLYQHAWDIEEAA